MPNRLFAALSLVALGVLGFGASAYAATAPTTDQATAAVAPASAVTAAPATGLTINRPQNDDTVVNSRVEIAGTAPAGILISVSIVDSDPGRRGIAHQRNGRVEGSVTSDAAGQWVFVPPLTMTPGTFEVNAAYTTASATIQSTAVPFVVVNEAGQSAVPSSGLKSKIAIALGVLLLGAGVVWYRRRWRSPRTARPSRVRTELERYRRDRSWPRPYVERERNGDTTIESQPQPLFMSTVEGRNYQRSQSQKMHAMQEEMQGIERALADTAQALEHSNTTIANLRRRISAELETDESEPAPDRTRPKQPQAGW